MRASKPTSKTRQAQSDIHGFYKLGRKSLKECPANADHNQKYGKLKSQASSFGVALEFLRKARAFADPKRGYTEAQFKRLCQACERAGFTMGTSFVVRLLAAPKGNQRLALQSKLIEERWSLSRLNQELAKRQQLQGRQGRRRRIPADPTSLLIQLQGICENWRRWQFHLERAPNSDKTGKVMEQKGMPKDLPKAIVESVIEVGEAIDKLKTEVAKQLTLSRQS
jgi:hypothetical protein